MGESHDIPTPNKTTEQHDGVQADEGRQVIERGIKAEMDRKCSWSTLHLLHLVQRILPSLAILAALYLLFWSIGRIEIYTGFRLFTNYRNIGTWTNQLQEHVFWAILAAGGGWWWTLSFKKALVCALSVFVLLRIGERWLGAFERR